MAFEYPKIPRLDTGDDYHGTFVEDPYRYMEDSENFNTKYFVDENNKLVDLYIDQDLLNSFKEKVRSKSSYTALSVPVKRGNRVFYLKQGHDELQPTIYVKDLNTQTEEAVLDINTLSEDGTTASMIQSYSPDGNFIALYLSIHGSDWQQVLVFDVVNRERKEILSWLTMGVIAWEEDSNGFYYTKYPDQTGLNPEEQRRNAKLYYHEIGTTEEYDKIIFVPASPNEGCSSSIYENYHFISLSETTIPENKLYFRSLDKDVYYKLVDEYDNSFYNIIGVSGNYAYLRTSWKAPNNRIMKIDLTDPDKSNWVEIIPNTEHVLVEAKLNRNGIVIQYLVDVKHQITIFDASGNKLTEVEMPTSGSIVPGRNYNAAVTSTIKDSDVFFGFTSFQKPMEVYHLSSQINIPQVFLSSELPLGEEEILVKQVFYNSKDGTQIPMYILSKDQIELNGENPTLLYGYGGYNSPQMPAYGPLIRVWLEEGGIFALANLRGGGEYGKQWHEQALLGKKQNVFDDFIAAAEWLIENEYTSNSKIAINGRSNGGLLVGATLVQRPDLIGAAIPVVGVLDMLRYTVQMDAGRYWAKEYGDAINYADHFEFLYEFSPYHNAKETNYPPTLVVAAEGDNRVAPMHSKKFAAALQFAQTGNSPILLRIETKSGHGYGKPISKIIEDSAYSLTFLKQTIG